jgi:biofilm PGA synthesis protein PgaA
VGTYDQRTFGSMPVGSVLYEHSWRRDPNTELVYGVGWNSNVYDGQRETSWQAYLTFLHRFGR